MNAHPDAHPPPAGPAGACALCGSALAPGLVRCPACGLYQELGPDHPNPFRRAGAWLLAGLLVAVYLASLAVVALAR